MKYPSHEVYATIYNRYIDKPLDQFTEHIDKLSPGAWMLDLCGGGGSLTSYALSKGLNVVYVDAQIDMIPNMLFKKPGVEVKNEEVLHYLLNSSDKFDLVVCRQAVNYWLKSVSGLLISKKIVPGGKFVFNTFSTKPPQEPTVKQYQKYGRNYTEVYYSLDDVVHHVQCCEGFSPHVTKFDWISSEEIISSFQPYFDIELSIKGASSFYVCTRKTN